MNRISAPYFILLGCAILLGVMAFGYLKQQRQLQSTQSPATEIIQKPAAGNSHLEDTLTGSTSSNSEVTSVSPSARPLVEAQSSGKQENWPKYSNSALGVSFKYPPDQSVFADYPDGQQIFVGDPANEPHRVEGVMILVDGEATTYRDRLLRLALFEGGERLLSDKAVELEGVQRSVRQVTYSTPIGYEVTAYYFTSASHRYEVIVRIPDNNTNVILNSITVN